MVEPVIEEVIGGWFSYALAPGWTVGMQATELERFRQDFDAEPIDEPRAQLLLALHSDESELFVFREMNFLNTNDELPWRAAVAETYLGDGVAPVRSDTVPGSHGDINRAFFQTERTVMVASSQVGDQLIGVIVDMSLEPDAGEVAAIDAILGSLQFDPDHLLPPLLNYHGAWAWRETSTGQRLVELDYDLPSDWQEIPGGHPTESSADGTLWFQVVFSDDDGSDAPARVERVVSDVLSVPGGAVPVIERTSPVTIDGFVFSVAVIEEVDLAALGVDDPRGIAANTGVAEARAVVVVADIGDVDVEIVMLDSTGNSVNSRLFTAIIQSFVVRAWDAAGEPLG